MKSHLYASSAMQERLTLQRELGPELARESASDAAGPAQRTALDRRQAPRARAGAGLRCLVSTSFAARIIDISQRGLCAEHTDLVEVGNVYVFDLELLGHPTLLRVEARAVWTDPHRTLEIEGAPCTFHRSGFAFVEASAETLAALESYVARRLHPQPDGPPAASGLPMAGPGAPQSDNPVPYCLVCRESATNTYTIRSRDGLEIRCAICGFSLELRPAESDEGQGLADGA